MAENFEIQIGGKMGWGGLVPSYSSNSYPFYGNPNQASEIIDMDLRDPNVLMQGAGVLDLSTHAGELGEKLIASILPHSVTNGITYACGEDKVFQIAPNSMPNGDYPLSITSGTANVATDIVYYKSRLHVFWNDTNVDGDIARVTLTPSISIEDNWGSANAIGAANLEDAPHYGIVGGNDKLYITNGQYIATVDDVTLTVQGLDFWTNSQTSSVTWNNNRIYVAVNRPNLSGSNFNQSGIYKWNGDIATSSWDGDPIEVSGEIGALYTKNGITYVWWKDGTSTGSYSFGYIDSIRLNLIQRYSGTLPNQAQVGEYDGFIGWISSKKLMLWGAKDSNVPVKLFQYMSPQYNSSVGGWAAPFGTPLIASKQTGGFTAATSNVITSTGHGLVDDDTIKLTTSNTLPAGLSLATLYYIIDATTNTFKVSTSQGGSEVNITDTGTGTHKWNQHSLARAFGIATTARWKSIAYDLRRTDAKAQIDLIQVLTEQMTAGAKCDFTLTYDQGKSTQELTQIAFDASNPTVHKILQKGITLDDFRLDLSYENGSITTTVKIRKVMIKGHFVKQN